MSKFTKIFLISCLSLVLFVFIAGTVIQFVHRPREGNYDPTPSPTTAPLRIQPPAVARPVTIEKHIEKIFVAKFGKTSNWDGKPQRLISISKDELKEGLLVAIEYRVNDNLTASLMKFGMFDESMDFYRSLFADPNCLKVWSCFLHGNAMLRDEFGNEGEGRISTLRLSRPTAQMINWDNMTAWSFEDLLIKYEVVGLRPGIFD